MADRASMVHKIASLLRTAAEDSGATEGERTNAIVMAQKLMLKHRVEEYELARVAGRAALPGIESVPGGTFRQGSMWIADVMQAVADSIGVDVFHNRYVGGVRVGLVGRPDSIAYVRLVTDWIVPQAERYCAVALDDERTSAKLAGVPWSWGETIRYKRSFFYALADRLKARLAAALEEEAIGQEVALWDRGVLDAYYEAAGMRVVTKRISVASLDTSGAAAGISAAGRVDVDPRNKVAPEKEQVCLTR